MFSLLYHSQNQQEYQELNDGCGDLEHVCLVTSHTLGQATRFWDNDHAYQEPAILACMWHSGHIYSSYKSTQYLHIFTVDIT